MGPPFAVDLITNLDLQIHQLQLECLQMLAGPATGCGSSHSQPWLEGLQAAFGQASIPSWSDFQLPFLSKQNTVASAASCSWLSPQLTYGNTFMHGWLSAKMQVVGLQVHISKSCPLWFEGLSNPHLWGYVVGVGGSFKQVLVEVTKLCLLGLPAVVGGPANQFCQSNHLQVLCLQAAAGRSGICN